MSSFQALFTQPQSKVLEWVFGQPERWYHIQELIRLTSLASASLQREVKRLHVAGLVVEERIGNLRRVKANPDSPVFADLANLVRKTMALGAIPAITDALRPLASSLQLALVFGSVAKGTEHSASDVDVLLVASSVQLGDALALLLPLEEQLGRRIEVKLYTPDEFSARRREAGSVVQRIVAGPVELMYGSLQ
jgi:predicted nucleotidyltransferase